MSTPVCAYRSRPCTWTNERQTFVYVVTAAQLEKKPIEIIYQTDSYCLVAQSTDSNALRAGNDIVVSGKGLSDGQVIK